MFKNLIIVSVMFVVFMVAGCAEWRLAGKTVTQAGVEARTELNDEKRDLTSVMMCDTSVGSFYRSQSHRQKVAISCLCGGICPGVDETYLNLPLTRE